MWLLTTTPLMHTSYYYLCCTVHASLSRPFICIRILHSAVVVSVSAAQSAVLGTFFTMDENNLTNLLNAEKERITVFDLETYKLVALVIWLMILLLVPFASNSAIIHYVIFYAQRRPLNTMMLIHQVCQLLTSTTFGSLTIFSLICRTPLKHGVY